MSAQQIMRELNHLNDTELLSVVEEAARLLRVSQARVLRENRRDARRRQMAEAVERLKDLYEPGGALTEWNVLDGEEFLDGSIER